MAVCVWVPMPVCTLLLRQLSGVQAIVVMSLTSHEVPGVLPFRRVRSLVIRPAVFRRRFEQLYIHNAPMAFPGTNRELLISALEEIYRTLAGCAGTFCPGIPRLLCSHGLAETSGELGQRMPPHHRG